MSDARDACRLGRIEDYRAHLFTKESAFQAAFEFQAQDNTVEPDSAMFVTVVRHVRVSINDAFSFLRLQTAARSACLIRETRLAEGAELSIGTHKAIGQGFVEPQSINFWQHEG